MNTGINTANKNKELLFSTPGLFFLRVYLSVGQKSKNEMK